MKLIPYRGIDILHVEKENDEFYMGYYVGAIYFGSDLNQAKEYIDTVLDDSTGFNLNPIYLESTQE